MPVPSHAFLYRMIGFAPDDYAPFHPARAEAQSQSRSPHPLVVQRKRVRQFLALEQRRVFAVWWDRMYYFFKSNCPKTLAMRAAS
jgi:hypothetical protein